MKKFVKPVVLLLVILALFFGVVGVAYASQATRSVCIRPPLWGDPPKVCLKGQYEFYSGGGLHGIAKWSVKEYSAGWQIVTFAPERFDPTGWTQGDVHLSAGYLWYRNGILKATRVCIITVDNVGGRLVQSRACN